MPNPFKMALISHFKKEGNCPWMGLTLGGLMKLTYTNRKWLLAAGLIAILGTNLSFDFNRFEQKYSTIELSSELAESSEEIEFAHDAEVAAIKEDVEKAKEETVASGSVRGSVENNRRTGPVRPSNLADAPKEQAPAKPATTASTKEETRSNKIYTSSGVLKVRYIEGDSENETLAIVQRSQTEGQSCNDCFETIHLGISNRSDIEELNDALMEKIAASEKAAPAERKEQRIAEKSEVVEMEEITDREVVRENVFDRVIEKCEVKTAAADKLACLSDGMISLMRSKNAKISSYEANTFFINEVQPLLINQISEARQKLSSQNSNTSSLEQLLFGTQADMSTKKEFVNELRRTVEKMIAKIPANFEDIRAKVMSIETQVLAMEVSNFHRVNEQAKTTTDANQKSQLLNDANDRFNTTKLLAELLMSSSGQAVSDANKNGLMDMNTTNVYNKFIQDFKTQFYASLSNPQALLNTTTQAGTIGSTATIGSVGNGSPVVIQGAQQLTTQDGRTVIILPAGVDINKRFQAPARGNAPVQATQGMIIPTTGQQIVVQPTTVQQPTTSIVVTPQPMASTATVLNQGNPVNQGTVLPSPLALRVGN